MNSIKKSGNILKYHLLRGFRHKQKSMTCYEARQILESKNKKVETSCIRANVLSTSEYDLQIIVPVYNVEKYLDKCLESIVHQKTCYTFCVNLIDDGSTDSSRTICEKYSIKNKCINYVHQDNKGIAGARNTGLSVIKANYLMFVDSDDFLEKDAVQKLMDKAYKEDADIVYGAHARLINDKKTLYRDYTTDTVIRDKRIVTGFPWGKVYKSELFKSIVFPEGAWFEDSINRFLIFPIAKNIYYIPDCIYNYRILSNSNSHSSDGKVKSIDTYWLMEILIDDYLKLGLPVTATFLETILKQSIVNYRRVRLLDSEVRQAVFVLTSELIKKHFNEDIINNYSSKLLDCFLNLDFYGYELWCSTH